MAISKQITMNTDCKPPMLMNSLLALLLVIGSGCGGAPAGPKLSPVKGRITLDDKPLPEAMVEFIPTQGRPSVAMTSADGSYDLKYTQASGGAVTGQSYTVKITTGREAVSAEGVTVQPAVPEKLPAKYNKSSELKAEIQPGSNVFDFALKSK